MAVSVIYDENDRLTLEGLDCSCPCEHHPVDKDIYIGKGLLERIPSMIERRGLGKSCVLVADRTTYGVAGKKVEQVLKAANFKVALCVIAREGDVYPDDEACGEVLLTIRRDTDFLISVGSGTITDTTRINAERTGLPFVAVGTAPSMDGYTSSLSPLLHHGVKIQVPAKCPEIIVCDLEILATAPMPMIASGVGDVLGKYIAIADWKIGQIINDEAFCPLCGELVENALTALIDNVDEIAARSERGMKILIEALILAGVTIMIIDNTRAVASVEHNIAQFWEMVMIERGLTPPMHGASVGVTTLMVWPLFERFLREDLSVIDIDKAVKEHISREDRERFITFAYGEEGGQQIIDTYPDDFLDEAEQIRRIHRAQERYEELCEVIRRMPPRSSVEAVMQKLHAEMTWQEEQIPEDLVNLSMWCGKDYRTRYTLMKTLEECGLLDKYLENYPRPAF